MGNCREKIAKLKDWAENYFVNSKYELSFVIEHADWVIRRIGNYVVSCSNKKGLIKARSTTTHWGLKNQIIHFGSINAFVKNDRLDIPDDSNKIVISWFHIRENDEKIVKRLLNIIDKIAYIHTAASETKRELVKFGMPEDKIVTIPLGINVSLFKKANDDEKAVLKQKYGIPKDKIVIGSFQKDGVGFKGGYEPKLIKGPDILVEVLRKLNNDYSIYVLLVGPARGYVENKLMENKISFKSIGFLDDFSKVASFYNMLDCYLITSRVEGGPQQILEAWASGIPVVSTNVGMIKDIARDSQNALLVEPKDVNGIVNKCKELIEDKGMQNKLSENGLEDIDKYSWENITRDYYKKIYSKV